MAISRTRKEELLAEYEQQLDQSQGLILAHYKALTVAQFEELRRLTREQNGQIFVVKNTLLQHALDANGIKVPGDLLIGPTLAAFCHQAAPPLAKVFREYAKEMEEGRFTVRGAIVEKHFYTAEQAIQLADLPGREQLLAQVLGTINAPASQMVGVVAGGIRQILNVVQAYVDKLEGGGTTAEAAA
ncbi:MAG: 50S ribosomal protein L10 [Anaerolineae bacterium]|nr:50S ribosomal protein L10 [Anaerolineae bacterium]